MKRAWGSVALVLAAAAAAASTILLNPSHVAGERHIAAAAGHVCVVQDGGSVACRGNATTTGKLYPPAGVAFHAVTVGDDFSCGLTAVNSSLRCWGALPGGTAQLPPASTFFVDAHAGPRHVCGLTPNGTVLCYGNATSLGGINVPPGVAFQGVTAGVDYTCGVARNHSVVCWGNATNPVVAAVATWQSITDAEHVAAGADHACYVRVNGSVACWGSNANGGAAPPTAVMLNGSVWWLAAGGGMTCAASGSSVPGPVTCWGAVSGSIASAGYEVACARWGCLASNSSARVSVVAAIGGGGIPQNIVGSAAVPGTVTTIAGNGASGTADGVGTAARFNGPRGLSPDGAGGLYVADTSNHLIRRVDITTRNVTTVAGIAGSSGRDVGATPLQSKFYQPHGVEVDSAGNVYVADRFNHAIRMLSGAWVAGSTSGTSGLADATVGTSATFNNPYVVRADMNGEKLYVADTYNNKIRTIATNGTYAVATFVSFAASVRDIALNTAARVMYVAVEYSVYTVTYAGVSTLLAGTTTSGNVDGTGSAAQFSFITGLALDAAAGTGMLYVADLDNNRIRTINIAGSVVTTFAGSNAAAFVDGIGTAASFNSPWVIALDAVSSALYIGDSGNHAIRRIQLLLSPLASATLAVAPLPPSPLAPTHQLTAWRALGTTSSPGAQPVLDARNATFSSPLAAANTAGLNPALRVLMLGAVTLAPRSAAPAAAGNFNTTFATSAQRGLRSVTLTTPTVPPAALALPALANLTLPSPTSSQQVQQLTSGSFNGLSTLTCINCAGAIGLANLSGLRIGSLLTQPQLFLPLITALDASATGMAAVNEHDFDGMPALRWLSLAGNSNLTYVSDTAFSATKQPALVVLDQSRTPLLSGTTCPSGTYYGMLRLPASGALYYACITCPAGAACTGGTGLPAPCRANTYAAGAASACAPCPTGTYAPESTKQCIACPPSLAAPGCNATASWRDTITLVADGAGTWVNTTLYLVPAGVQPAKANVSCGPLAVFSANTVSCALLFLLPAASTAPVLTNVWVAHAGTGGVPQRLNASFMLVPPLPVVLAPGGGIGLASLTPGIGRVVLRLPAPRLTAADWTATGLQPPAQATIDNLAVWLDGAQCTDPAWEAPTTLSCATPTTDATNVAVVVQLAAGAFNISGVLPSLLLSAPALGANTELQLLPPAQSAHQAINITLAGIALCAGGVPQLAAASLAGVPCASVVCVAGRSDAALFVIWNASHSAVDMLRANNGPQVAVNVSVAWVNPATRPVTCDVCVTLATRPVLVSITPTSIAAPGLPVVATSTGMMDATRAPPTVYIGGEVCSGIVVLSQTVVQCNAPTVQPSAPGYPVVSVKVVNAAGAASTEPVNLTYPASFAVSWAPSTTLTALPGGVLSPAPTLQLSSREEATCSLAINITSCATSNPTLVSRPTGVTVTTPAAALTVGASGTPDAVLTDLLLDALATSGASGCTGTLTASCVDAVGLTASTTGQSNPTVVLAAWRADWTSTSLPAVVVPEALPVLSAVFTLVGSDGVLTAASVTSLSCMALLLPTAVTPPPLSQSLDRVSTRDVLSSVSGTVALINGSAAGIAFDGLTASAARLGQALALYAECTWVATSERVRLPTLPLAVANVSLVLTPATTLLVEAYESDSIAAAATLSPPGVGNFASAAARCTWRPIAASSLSILLAAASSAASWIVDVDGAVMGGQPLALTVEGPPSTTLTLQLVCSLWGGNTVVSPLLNVTTRAYAVTLRDGTSGSAVVRAVWPSGTSAVLPWAPALDVTAPARNVLTCSVSAATTTQPPTTAAVPGVGLGLADAALQLVGETSVSVSLGTAATRANVSLPRVGLRAAGGAKASLVLTCRDGVGRSAALGVPINVSVAALTAAWTDAAMPSVVVPSQALPALTLSVASSPAVPLPPGTDVVTLLSCVAGVFRASTPLPLTTPLAVLIASASPFTSFSTSTGGATITTGVGNASIVVTLPQLPTAACPLDTQLVVAAECTWTPTGERMRLPTLTTSTLQLTLAWDAPPAIALAYTSLSLHLTGTIGAPATSSNGAATTTACEVLLVNAAVRSTRLVADTWSLAVDGSASGAHRRYQWRLTPRCRHRQPRRCTYKWRARCGARL